MKKINKALIEEWLRTYYYWVLFPLALALLLVGCYGYINDPGIFMVQKISCYGNFIDCVPETSEGFSVLGVSLQEGFEIRVVDDDEFERINKINQRANISVISCLILIIAGFILKYKKRLKELWNK